MNSEGKSNEEFYLDRKEEMFDDIMCLVERYGFLCQRVGFLDATRTMSKESIKQIDDAKQVCDEMHSKLFKCVRERLDFLTLQIVSKANWIDEVLAQCKEENERPAN